MEEKNNIRLPKDFKESWTIGIYSGTSPLHLTPMANNTAPAITRHDVTDIPATFVADPFMIQANGTWYLFMEILNAETELGEIGLSTSTDGINWEYQKIVLKENYHLSYSFVFEHEDEYYMVPETLDANAIRLYKAKNFPYDWQHVRDLATGQYADPTLFKHNDKWWMFAASKPYESNTLNLFYADKLTGPYVEHPESPVVENNRHNARPAGRIIQDNNQLIRLCQDCFPMYGSCVRAFEILELSTTIYVEKEVENSPILKAAEEEKQWNSRGMHHIDAHQLGPDNWIACVDGCYYDKPIFKKRAVWIFDDSYKIPTFLSVASFREHVNIPISLIYNGTPDQELIDAFKSLGGAIEFIPINEHEQQFKSWTDRHRENRLARMKIMRQWPEEQVILFDGDLIFSEKIKELPLLIDEGFKNIDTNKSVVWGVPEYDLKFYTQKRHEDGSSTFTTEEELHQSLANVFGFDWKEQLTGVQYNNGMLVVFNCDALSRTWEKNYLKGIDHPQVNPEDDQLPLRVSMFNHKTEVRKLDIAFNSLGNLTGDYAVYHAWNGKWKAELDKLMEGSTDLEDYGLIAQFYYHKMPIHWSEKNELVAVEN
jgi:hypothetical protein